MSELLKKNYYRLICCDMDGTLLDSNKNILPRTNEVIKKAVASGMQFVIATGRPPTGVLSYQDKLKVNLKDCLAVCYNGAVTYRLKDLKMLTVHTQEGSLISELYNLAAPLGLTMHGFSATRGLVVSVHNEYTNKEIIHAHVPWQVIDFANLSSDEGFYKCILSGDVQTLDKVREMIPSHIKQKMSVMRSAPNFLEFIAGASSKGSAVAELCQVLDVPLNKVIAFGDAENDESMLKEVGLGVAMGNSAPEALAASKLVTASCDEDGIAQVLEQII